ncbi:hypothetical protein AVEN_75304-1 [Araneus ventricosus]|uniref:Uncharacterized protein n=1 Tax=Araneus ventricosus TaxID=182803 RepID=A0A4Y2G3S0_ARAVE|nr:hypothetical protein AVEN_75304-1 [Araneus ventricosus]
MMQALHRRHSNRHALATVLDIFRMTATATEILANKILMKINGTVVTEKDHHGKGLQDKLKAYAISRQRRTLNGIATSGKHPPEF